MHVLGKSLAATALCLSALALPTAPARAASVGMPESACAPLDAFAVKALRDGVKSEYRPSYAGCALAIEIAACAPPVRPSEIVYVEGHGHTFGTTLTITSLRREGTAVEVTRLLLTRGGSAIAKFGGERSDSVKVLRGTVSGLPIEAAMSLAEVAHALTPREVEPPDSTIGGGWMTSSDFIATVTLVTPGAVVDRSFVGYSANDTQLQSLPLTVAIARLDAAIVDGALAPSTFDSTARALFVSELARRAPTFDDQFHWWVREAFVRAAGDAGDLSVASTLRRYLAKSDPSSGERTRIAAISALAALTGVDRRFDGAGVERPVDAVALDYLKMLASK